MEQVRPLLPDDLRDYFIFSFDTNDIPVMVGRISSRGRDLAGSYDLLERRVINPLRRVEGVGRVNVDGISPKEVTIYLLLDKIIEHGIDVGRLFERLNANNLDLSLGRVRAGSQRFASDNPALLGDAVELAALAEGGGDMRLTVRSLGQFRGLAEVENLVVSEMGLRLADIAEVVYGEPAPNYYRRLGGQPAVAFEIQKASGANIVEVSERVRGVLDAIKRDPALEGIDVVLFFDQAEDIRESLRSLLLSGFFGSILAVGILLFFLRSLRTTLVVSLAIPISVVPACVFLYLSQRTLNILTMMGLMLAVGLLVDNAIVVLESIYRRQEKGEAALAAARSGAQEVGMAVFASTLTSIIVFAPIIVTKNDEMSIWLGEVGVTISITLVFSLLICLTLIPLMASRSNGSRIRPEFRILERLRGFYLRKLLGGTLRRPKLTALVFLPVFIVVTVLAMQITGFKPSNFEDGEGVQQNNLYFQLDFTENTNVYRVREIVDRVEPFLLAQQDSLGLDSVYTFYQDNYAAFSLFFPEGRFLTHDEILELRQWLREELPEIAGVDYRLGREDDVGRGAQQLSLTLFGEDTELLEDLSEEVQRRLALLPGLEDIGTDVDEGRDEVRVSLDRQVAGSYGISPAQLAQVLGLTFRGVPLRKFQGAEREIELGIVLEPSDRRNIDNLKRLPVTYREDRPILLGQVASFEIAKGPQGIRRESQKTALTVNATYEGEDFGAISESAERIMDSLEMPAGYSWSFGRRLRQSQEQRNDLGANALLAVICVYLVMAALFESFLHPLVIMQCIPFAILGVIWTLMLTGTPFNLFAIIGVVILIGIVVNNGIVLIDHINNLRRSGLDRRRAIVSGCRDRFRPIIMTAATTVLGLTPLALGKAAVADGYYYPLARAVMGGLATSTVLTLVVLPTFYVLAEDGVAYIRRVIAWGMGRGPLPWQKTLPEAQGAVGGDVAPERARS
jgi:HAE1 family hydrophobic/amphiphilic exporter-1